MTEIAHARNTAAARTIFKIVCRDKAADFTVFFAYICVPKVISPLFLFKR